MTRNEAYEIKKLVEDGRTVNNAGGIKTDIVQSDKIGYDWQRTFVNDILVKSVYVEQKIPMGTAENPIVWKEGMVGINNAYYLKDNVRYVYMAGEFVEF